MSHINSIKQAQKITLVPNRRAYDLCIAAHFLQAAESQVLVAPALEVLSRWVERTSSRIDLLRGLAMAATADHLQQDQAWQQAVRERPEWTSPHECQALAHAARAADRMLRHWWPADRQPWLSPGFHAWQQSVRANLRSRRLFTPEDWLAHLRVQLDQANELPLELPTILELRGFVEFTRLERSLLDALQRRGTQVIDASAAQDHGMPVHGGAAQMFRETRAHTKHALHAFDSGSEELRAAASWAAGCLSQGRQRVAIVVNGLDGLADELVPVFDRIIHPNDFLHVALSGDSSYHLPDGSRLSDHAVTGDALLLLRLSQSGMEARHVFPEISRLLLSPHIGGWAEEAEARARFELHLRTRGRYHQSLQDVASRLSSSDAGKQLPVLRDLLAHASSMASGPDVAGILHQRLLAWGWPGPMRQGTLAGGRVKQFMGLLERTRQSGPSTAATAIAMLSQWCRDTRLTERGGPLSPIQILGPEDAVGQHFDAAWVCNVHDGNWPGRPAANPFLPTSSTDFLPRGTPQGELDFTRKVHGQLIRLAPEVHFSWSSSGDDVPRQASPLLSALAEVEDSSDAVPHWPLVQAAVPGGVEFPVSYAGHPWLQAVDDTRGLPLRRSEKARIPGGSAMLKYQSACPMAAYLLHRLQLRFDPMPGPFADYAYRGRLLHEALYQLFREQPGSPGLPSRNLSARAVDLALQRHQASLRLGTPALRAERQRLELLLRQWLEFEQQRQGFAVLAVEQGRTIGVRGLEMDIRIDRIDRLQDGRLLIVDYKSGAASASGWLQERIAEPQLPLYAVLLDQEQPGSVGGLALASVRSGDCRMAGVVDDPLAAVQSLYSTDNRRSNFGQRFANWEGLMNHWKAGIGRLLDEIVTGYAANCVHDPKGLSYAGLDALLRRTEGEAWLLAHGEAMVMAGDADG